MLYECMHSPNISKIMLSRNICSTTTQNPYPKHSKGTNRDYSKSCPSPWMAGCHGLPLRCLPRRLHHRYQTNLWLHPNPQRSYRSILRSQTTPRNVKIAHLYTCRNRQPCLDSAPVAHRQAIGEAVDGCRKCVNGFLKSVEKYGVVSSGKMERVKGVGRTL